MFVTSKPVDAFLKGRWDPGFKFLPVEYDAKFEDYYLPSSIEATDYPNLVEKGTADRDHRRPHHPCGLQLASTVRPIRARGAPRGSPVQSPRQIAVPRLRSEVEGCQPARQRAGSRAVPAGAGMAGSPAGRNSGAVTMKRMGALAMTLLSSLSQAVFAQSGDAVDRLKACSQFEGMERLKCVDELAAGSDT